MESSNKKILLTGGSGQLGTELRKVGDYIVPDHYVFDITNEKQVKEYLDDLQPDLIVHAAAYTKTLTPDSSSTEAYICYQANVIGTRNIVRYAKCPIIYISTESAVDPYNFYVLTKMQGENEIKNYDGNYRIIRTSFRERPFEYDKACYDVYTLGDYVDVIAGIINMLVLQDAPFDRDLVYVGTGFKSTYDLACQTKPEIQSISRVELNNYIPSFEELKQYV